MCKGSTAIVLLALQYSFAACKRTTLAFEHADTLDVDAHDEVFIDAFHAQGLEHEHSFELNYYRSNESTDNAWLATKSDEVMIGDLLSVLNPPGADAPWTWENVGDHWTFGLVKLTAATAKGSLALHMLHRHGLAPLIAARAGQSFEKFLNTRNKSEGMSSLQFLVQSEEEFEEVKQVRGLLESLTLNGLRSLHSFDHQWSVTKFKNKVEGCTECNAGSCILQGGVSATAHNFLVRHGFLGPDASEAHSDFQELLGSLDTKLDMRHYHNFMKPDHTGDKKTNLELVEYSFMGRTTHYLKGSVRWEDGGLSSQLNIKIDSPAAEKIRNAEEPQKSEYIEAEFENHIKDVTRGHKGFMKQHRLKIWTHEEVEFTEMFERLPK